MSNELIMLLITSISSFLLGLISAVMFLPYKNSRSKGADDKD